MPNVIQTSKIVIKCSWLCRSMASDNMYCNTTQSKNMNLNAMCRVCCCSLYPLLLFFLFQYSWYIYIRLDFNLKWFASVVESDKCDSYFIYDIMIVLSMLSIYQWNLFINDGKKQNSQTDKIQKNHLLLFRRRTQMHAHADEKSSWKEKCRACVFVSNSAVTNNTNTFATNLIRCRIEFNEQT